MLHGLLYARQVIEEKAKSITGVHQWPYKAVAKALEVIPRTLIQNCGANTIRTLTALRVSFSYFRRPLSGIQHRPYVMVNYLES